MSLTVGTAMAAIGKKGAMALAVKAGVGMLSYNQARDEGKSAAGAAAKGVFDGFVIDKIGPGKVAVAKALAATPSVAVNSYYALDQQRRRMGRMGNNLPFETANFVNTQQAHTMRQAGLQMAQQSQFNRQQAMLGNEAQYFG